MACQHSRRRTRYSLGEAAADIARKSNRYSTTASFALRGGSTVIQMREVRSRTEGQPLSLTEIIAREAAVGRQLILVQIERRLQKLA